jgi:hypothetical protein
MSRLLTLSTAMLATALVLGGCSSDLTAPEGSTSSYSTGSCAGGANEPGNQPCNRQQGGGGGSNNPPTT